MNTLRRAAVAAALAVAALAQSITVPGLGTPVSVSWLYYNKMRWAGAWSGSTTYNAQDVVTYGSNTYVSAAGFNLNNTPAAGPWWTAFPIGSSPFPTPSAQLQYLRSQPNAGNNTTLQFSALPYGAAASDYNYPAQTPGGSLVAMGVGQAITLTPCPVGIVSSSVWAPVYLSGGTGTAEGVTPTGGTCTSGAASGTILVTPANAHSGAWTVSSATGGVSEAMLAAPAGSVVQITGSVTFYTQLTAPAKALTVRGSGLLTYPAITRASTYPNGDLILAPAGSFVNFEDLTIFNSTGGSQTSGAAIHIQNTAANLTNVYVATGGYIGYEFEAASTSTITASAFYTSSSGTYAGAEFIANASHVPCTDIRWTGGFIYGGPATYSMLLTGMDSLTVAGVSFGSGLIGLAMLPAASTYVGNIVLTGNSFDNGGGADGQTNAIVMGTPHASAPITQVLITGNKVYGEGTAASTNGIDIQNSGGSAAQIGVVAIAGNYIQDWGVNGIAVGTWPAHMQIVISGNTISDNNTHAGAGFVGGISLVNSYGVNINGNTFWGNDLYNVVLGAACTDISITANDMTNFASLAVYLSTPPAGFQFINNLGVDNVEGTVASFSSIALPSNPNFTVTGVTGVGTVTEQWAGKAGTFITPNGAVTFTAGGTIGNTFTTTQNVPVSYWSDGTKIWMH